jgi:hypothetical protein
MEKIKNHLNQKSGQKINKILKIDLNLMVNGSACFVFVAQLLAPVIGGMKINI